MSTGAPIGALLTTVLEAIAEVALICVIGYGLSRRGILDAKARKFVNRINVSVFTPALLFSKVAFSLTPDKLGELYIVPLGFFGVTLVSAAAAWLLGKLFRLPRRSQRMFAIACASFPNSNSLPVALMQSLVVSVHALKWGHGDTKDQMLGRALVYLSFCSVLGMIMRWSVGVRMLAAADDIEPSTPKKQLSAPLVQSPPAQLEADDPFDDADRSRKARIASEPSSVTLASNGSITPPKASATDSALRRASRRSTRPLPSFPNTPAHSQYGDEDDEEEGSADETREDAEWGDLPGGARNGTSPSGGGTRGRMVRGWRRTRSWVVRRVWRPTRKGLLVVRDFMTVPLYAALLSIIVACIPPLQSLLEDIKPLVGSLRSAGNCSVPLTLIVLGGFMHQEDPTPVTPARAGSRPRPTERPTSFSRPSVAVPARNGETRTVIVALLSRMIVPPLLLLPPLYWWSKETTNVADDPVFLVVACLVIGSPPAITLAQITDAAGPQFERLISKTLLFAYAALSAPTTVVLVVVGLLIAEAQ